MYNQLHALSRLDDAGITFIKQRVLFAAEKAKRILSAAEQQRFMDWAPMPNQVLINTDYAMIAKPVTIPIQLSKIVIKASNQDINTIFTIPYAVFRVGNYYFPYHEIEPGHSYLIVTSFPLAVPEAIQSLPVFGDDRLPNSLGSSLFLKWEQ